MDWHFLHERQRLIIMDLSLLASLFSAILYECQPEMWKQRGPHVKRSEWTLQQTLAHLVSASGYYLSTLQYACQGKPLVFKDLRQRYDLSTYNVQEIQRLQHVRPTELIATLHQTLLETAALAEQMTVEQLCWRVSVPIFNRDLTLLEVLEMQLVHPGIVHAAQLALPMRRAPFWTCYDPTCMHRMLERFFSLMALIYWPERGKNLRATIQFQVAGAAGGTWSIVVDSSHCQCSSAEVSKPRVRLWVADADIICKLFTHHLSLPLSLMTGKLILHGDFLLASKLSYLFSPT